jgi:hypothetical protein
VLGEGCNLMFLGSAEVTILSSLKICEIWAFYESLDVDILASFNGGVSEGVLASFKGCVKLKCLSAQSQTTCTRYSC